MPSLRKPSMTLGRAAFPLRLFPLTINSARRPIVARSPSWRGKSPPLSEEDLPRNGVGLVSACGVASTRAAVFKQLHKVKPMRRIIDGIGEVRRAEPRLL